MIGPFVSVGERDRLAQVQHTIHTGVINNMIDNTFARDRLIEILHDSPQERSQRVVPEQLTPGALAQLQFEIWQRITIRSLAPMKTLWALAEMVVEGRQLVADRYCDRLNRELSELAHSSPKEHLAYKVVSELKRAGMEPDDYLAWRVRLARVNANWNSSNLYQAAALADGLENYANKRKRLAHDIRKEMEVSGFALNEPLIKPVQQLTARESVMYSTIFSLWDYLRIAAMKQARSRATQAA